jgi:group I intron endonuclease
MIGIYKITSPSGKIYIGQSTNIPKRIQSYRYSSTSKQIKIYRSIKKYGIENHIFDVVEECSICELNSRERYWQDYYDVIGVNGLNCTLQGYNDKSGKLSKETIDKIKKNRKGITSKYKNPELRLYKISESLKGKKLSDAHKKSISISQIGLKRSPEAIRKSAESRRGLKFGQEFKDKIKIRQSGGSNSFAKITLNIETGIYYETASEAAASLGWSYARFSNYINGRTKRKLPFIYV